MKRPINSPKLPAATAALAKGEQSGTMAVTPLRTAEAAEGHDGVDPDPVWRALKGVSSVLGRVACALAPAAGSFGTAGSCRRGASGNLGGIAEIVDDPAEIVDGGVGGPAGICPAGRTLDRTGRVLVRVGDGRPVRSVSRNWSDVTSSDC
jgi:hypothetical protein